MFEAINAFFVLIMFLGLLTGVVSLIALLIMAIRKDKLKTPLWLTGSAFFVAFIGFLGGSIISTVITFNEPIATTESDYSGVEVDGMTDDEIEETIDKALESTEEDEPEIEKEADEIDEIIAEADERIAEREREEQEALDNRPDTGDLDNYRTDVDVRDIERNPDDYIHELIVFEGKIIQVLEEGQMSAYRIAVNDDYARIVLVSTLSSSLEERLLEGDYVTVYGEFTDLLTYETVIGGNRTVPSFVASGERIILQNPAE